MQTVTAIPKWVLAVLAATTIAACDGRDSETVAPPPAGQFTRLEAAGGLQIDVEIAEALGSDIRIAAQKASGHETSNAYQATLVLSNSSANEQRVLVSAQWASASGQSRGGRESSLTIAARGESSLSLATRATDAERLRVSVRPSAASDADIQSAALLEAAAADVEGYGIAYTASPTLAAIPAWSPRGLANGELFQAKSIIFMPIEGKWKLEIHDHAVDPMKGVAFTRSSTPDLQTIYLNLPEAPYPGAVFDRPLEYGGGYFQIKQGPAEMTTTSWNTSVAWVIEITEWQQQPWQEDGWTFQRAGTASGRLYICFKGSPDQIASSFVAGEFSDAPIMYYGPPG